MLVEILKDLYAIVLDNCLQPENSFPTCSPGLSVTSPRRLEA